MARKRSAGLREPQPLQNQWRIVIDGLMKGSVEKVREKWRKFNNSPPSNQHPGAKMDEPHRPTFRPWSFFHHLFGILILNFTDETVPTANYF